MSIQSCQGAIATYQRQIRQHEAAIRSLDSRIADCRREIEHQKDKKEKYKRSLAKLREIRDHLEANHTTSKRKSLRASDLMRINKKLVAKLSADIDEKVNGAEYRKLKHQISDKEMDSERKINDCRNRIADLESDINRCSAEIANHRSAISRLNSLIAQTNAEIERLRAEEARAAQAAQAAQAARAVKGRRK